MRPPAAAIVTTSSPESGFDGLFGQMVAPAGEDLGNAAAAPGKTLPVPAARGEAALGEAMTLLPQDTAATGSTAPARLRGPGDKRPVSVVRDFDPGPELAEAPASDDPETSSDEAEPVRDRPAEPAIAASLTLPALLPATGAAPPVLPQAPDRRIEPALASPATPAQQAGSPSFAVAGPPAPVSDAPVIPAALQGATALTVPAAGPEIRQRLPDAPPALAPPVLAQPVDDATVIAAAAPLGVSPAPLDTATLLGRRTPARAGLRVITGDEPTPLLGSGLTTGAALAASASVVAPPIDLTRATWPTAMIDRIEHLRDAADAVSTSIRVIPDALGAIHVSVQTEGEVTHVHLAAENAQTRALLADASPRLAEIAEQRGLKLGRTDIDVGGSGGGSASGDRQQPAAEHRAPPRPAPRTPHARAVSDDHRVA